MGRSVHSESPETQPVDAAVSFLISSFLKTISSNLIRKIQRMRMRKWLPQLWRKTVNYVFHCNTNHLVRSFPFLILWGLLERTHTYLAGEHNRSAKSDKYQSQFFVMLCEHCKHCLKYFNLNFSLLPCFASHSIKQVLCIESVGYLKFL